MRAASLFYLLATQKTIAPHQPAVRYREQAISYGELYEEALCYAKVFTARFKKGAMIALYMENSPEWLAVYFGIIASGMVAVPLSLRSSNENLIAQLSFTNSVCVAVSPKYKNHIEALLASISGADAPVLFTPLEAREASNALTRIPIRVAPYSVVLFTSGTTSAQKAVRISQKAAIAATRNIVDRLALQTGEVYYAILPFYHSFGLGNVHAVFAVGGTVVVSDAGIDIREVLRDIVRNHATFFAATPYTLESMVLNFFDEFTKTGSSVRTICTNTGPMPEAVTKVMLAHLPHTQFFTYYGLTEASRSTFMHYNRFPDALASVGTPPKNVSIRIRDENGKPLRQGSVGEICIRGPHVVNGYWKNPRLTRERFRGSWLRTRDRGYLNTQGFLFVVGREDDVADIGGEKFSLEVVDVILRSIPGVVDAASFVQVRPRMPVVVSCVVPDPASARQVLTASILATCRARLDRHQVPAHILFVDAVPRTDSGKLKRSELVRTYPYAKAS